MFSMLIRNFTLISIIIQLIFHMAALNSLKHLIYQFDMFCSSQLLRYRSETQHKTLTGGLISLAIISVVVGGFASMVGDTLNRVAITSSLVTKKMLDPPLVTLQPGNEKMFMIGFAIHTYDAFQPLDLINGPQYFSIIAKNYELKNGVPINISQMKLEQCTREHWSMMPEFASGYDSFGIAQWLCLSLGASYIMQGSYTSSAYSFLALQVVACKNSTSYNRCASQADTDAFFARNKNFFFNYNFINPVINPNQQDFLSYYVNGNDYVLFSPSSVGAESWLLFSDFTITTDDSILPYSHITQVTGSIVEQRAIPHPYSTTDSLAYAKIILAKSENSLFYQRDTQKISAVLSYIGGLVGAITAILFLVKSYTDTSLEIAIGFSLFELSKDEKQKENKKQNKMFSMFGFAQLTSYRLLRLCGWKGKLSTVERLEKFQQEAIKQMDVQLLLKRVIKLETCMSKLFTPQQLKEIREGQTITFKSAKNMRMLLLKERQQANEEEQQSNEGNNKREVGMEDVFQKYDSSEEKIKCKQRSQLQSGTSIHILKHNKFGQFLKPSDLQIEEVKAVTRKAIIKRRAEEETEKAEDGNEICFRNGTMQNQPIII